MNFILLSGGSGKRSWSLSNNKIGASLVNALSQIIDWEKVNAML